jgi:hypothetical protein
MIRKNEWQIHAGNARSLLYISVSFFLFLVAGMDLTRQRLALVSKMNSGDYKISVIDKWDADQKSSGTKIIIKFPLRA